MARFTVISWCNAAYRHLAEGLAADCAALGYQFRLYEIERHFPSLNAAWTNHPHVIRRGVLDFGTVLFLDVECRIVRPIPDHWTAPLVSRRSPAQPFWITYNTGTVMADADSLHWIDAWIHTMDVWDIGNLPHDAYIYWPSDICDELAFNAAVTASRVELVTPLLEYTDRDSTAEIARGLWRNAHTVIQHPTIHHWPQEHNPEECKKLFWQNFPGRPEDVDRRMGTGDARWEDHGWVFDAPGKVYAPSEIFASQSRTWWPGPIELTSAQR